MYKPLKKVNITKFGVCGIVLILLFTLIFIFSFNIQGSASAWEPPGTYDNRSYDVSQSSMVNLTSYGSYTASGHAYGYSHQKSHSGEKWHTQSTSDEYANYVMTIKLPDHIYNAFQRGYVTLKATSSCEFKTENRVADARFYMKAFVAVGTISGTGLARDNFTNTNTGTGSEQYDKFRNNSKNKTSTATISSGSTNSGQYVRFGASFRTKSDKSGFPTYSTALAQINNISLKLEISHSGDTTDPSISGTHNAFTASSSVTLSDTGSGLRRYRINSGSWQNIASSSGPTTSKSISLSQGTNNIEVEDNVGRTASKTIKYYNPTISIDRYTDGASSSTGGSITGNNSSGKTVGGSHSMTASANAGYYFSHWEKTNGASASNVYNKTNSYTIVSGDAYTTTLYFRAHFKSITTSNKTVIYDGNSHDVSFSPDSGFSVSYYYTNRSGTPSYSSSTGPKEAGSYDAKITVTRGGQEMGTKTVTLTINKRDITVIPNVGLSKTYGQNDPVFSYQIISGSLVDGDSLSGSLSRQPGEIVGTYNITQGTLTSANNRNYNISFESTRTFAINKKPITITPNSGISKIYGNADPSLGYTHTSLVSGDTFGGKLTRDSGENVGSYNILRGTLNIYRNGSDYESNYDITFVENVKFTITKRNLTVIADDIEDYVYGDALPAYTVSYTNKLPGDDIGAQAYCSYSRYQSRGDNGEFQIKVLLYNLNPVADNYTITPVDGTLTVNKRDITIKLADAFNNRVTYGDEKPSSYEFDFTNVVNNDEDDLDVYADTTYYKYAPVNQEGYEINIWGPASYTNYNATFIDGTLIVNKKKVTLSIAVVGDVYYGDNPPENFTFNYSGLVNGDQISDTAYTDYYYKGNAGSYNIYVTEKAHTNYYVDNIASPKGTFTVKKKPITVIIYNQYIDYGDSIPTFTYSQGDLVSGDSNLTHIVETDYVLGESDCGEYSITPVDGQNNFTNYDVTYVNGTLTVYQKTVELTINDENIEYGDAINDFSFSYDGVVFNQESLFDQEYQYVTTNYNQFDDIGTYPLYFDYGYENPPEYTNYFVNRRVGMLTVSPRKLKITPNDIEIEYGMPKPTEITFNFENVVNDDILTATGEILNCDDILPLAGIYDIVVTGFNETLYKNYTWNQSGIGKLIVNKRKVYFTVDNMTVKYGEELGEFVFNVTGVLSQDHIEYSLSASVDYQPFVTNAGTILDIIVINSYSGEYPNYEPVYQKGALTVIKADAVITAEEYQLAPYMGSKVYPVAYLNHDEASIIYNPDGAIIVAEYTFTLTAPATQNYNAPEPKTVLLKIEQRYLEIKVLDVSKVYGESDPVFGYTVSGLAEGDTLDIALRRQQAAVNHVGSYEITYSRLDVYNDNGDNVTAFYDYKYISAYLTIMPFELTITAQSSSKIYGESDPDFEYTVSHALKYSDRFTGRLSREAGEHVIVGVYQITMGTLAISDGNNGLNYDINFINDSAFLTINPRTIYVQGHNKSKVYGEDDPEFTYEISSGSLVNGDYIYGQLERETGQTVNEYHILQGNLAIEDGNQGENYIMRYNIGILTITQRDIEISAHNKSKIYGEQDPEFTFSITKGNLVYDDELWGDLTRVTGENVGKYAISKGVLRVADSEGFYREDNYSVTFINAELTITQREIEIIADNKTKIYGQNDPTFTFVLAAGSMGLAFSDYWSGTLSRDMGENVDSYVINRGSLGINGLYDNGNYIITFNSGILTITRKAIQVVADASQSKIYGFSDPILTFHVPDNGLEFGDELQGELTRRAGEDVGFYEIYQNNVDNNNNPNYDITFVSNLFEIIQRPITIQADPKGKVYGEDDPELTYSISAGSYGLAFDDELAGSLEREWGINVGYYDILQGSVTTSNNPNYQITFKFQGNDFEITQRPITLSADYINKVYGDGDPALTYSIVSGNLVYSDKVSITLIRDTGENVGSYEIDQEYLEIYSENDEIISFNYQITFIKGEFEITQRYLYIKGDDLSKSYGQDDPPVFTYQITQGELVWDDEIGGALTREPGNNAGTYKILIGSLTAGENYKIVYTHGEFEIIPLPIKIVADEQVKTYGDLDPEFTHTITAGEIMPGDDLEITLSRESGEDIGIYEITVGLVSNANYEISLESGHLTIIPREIKVSADRVEKVYGFEDPELTYIVEEGELAFDDTLTHRLERVLGEDVGVYAITLIEVEKDNYIIDFTGNDFIIHERPITIQADYKEKVYGEDDPELTYSFVAGSLGLAFEDELWGELIRDAGDFVDEYIIRQGSITDENNTNYLITFIEGVFSITRRDVTVTPDILTKYYGEDDPFFTYTVGENDLVYEDTLVGELTRVLGENVGFYRILNGGITNENNPNYNIILIPIDFEIERRHITVTPDILTKYYGEGDPFFTYTVGENDLVFDDTLVGELTRVLGENVGLYQILNGSLTNENNTNYDITLSEVYFEIERRPITLTADDMSKTYGDQDPPVYTYQLSENALVFNDVLQGRLTREAGDVVGHYTILQGGITNENNPNYDITYVEADFEIIRRPIELHANYHEKIYGYPDPVFSYQIIGETVPGDMLQGSLQRAPGNNVGRYTIYQGTIDNENNPNYDITFKGNILIINPRPLIILADMIEKIYGEEDPALTYTFLQGSLAYEDVLYGSLFRQVGEDVGRYTISVGDIAQHPGNRNYSITYQYNSFEIIPRPITIQADQKSKVYGEADPKLTYQIVEGSLVEGDSIRGSLVRIIGNDVGEYEILQGTVNNLENGNYDISYIGNTLEITPRPITITVDDGLEKYYGNQDPEFTYKVTEGNLAYYDTLKGEFIRDQGEQVGFYEIYQGTINEDENPNYQITFIGNCLEIRRRPIVVAPAYLKKIYGEEDPELTHEVIEGGLVFDDELVGAIYREPGEQAGEYEIYQGTLTTENNDNYLITYHHRPFIIERRPIVLTAERRSKVYGIADPTFAYEITEGNLVGSDVLVGQLNREQGEDVGEYRIIHGTLNLDNNPNYNIILTEVYFEITPKLIVVSANYRSKIYGNSDPTLTYEITYGDLIEGDELSGSLEREEGEAVGQYEITLGTLGNRNYDIIFESNTFAIHKRPLTLYALEQTHRHGEIIELEMAFGIEGNPLSQDIELINEAVKVVTPATSDSPVGTYPIEIVPLYDLENYSLTFIPSILTIIAGTFEVGEEIWFEDKRVIYDGTEHSILAGWNLEGVTVTYANNSGTEVGIYHATATFHKEHYLDVTLNARLIIMTKQITTTEPVPRGIVSVEGGFDPHVVPVIHQSTDENILTLANSILNVDLREEVKTILNIRLQADSEEIVPSSTVEIKLLIPSQIDNLESLRLVHITSTGINNVEYVIEGDYIVFYGYELGDYAFITAQEAPSYEKTAQIIFYTSTGAIGLIVFVIISTAFRKKKKRLKRGGRYL